MDYCFDYENTAYLLRPVTEADLEETVALCDACVGKNLYPRERIREAMAAEDQFFYLLENPAGEAVGYLFFLLTDPVTIARSAKTDPQVLTAVCDGPERVCRLQSIALREDYRGTGLAENLLNFALGRVRCLGIRTIYVVCWKAGLRVPLEKPLQKCGFSFLTEAKKVWYDEPLLHCPYCNGRCHCDAEIYYKVLGD